MTSHELIRRHAARSFKLHIHQGERALFGSKNKRVFWERNRSAWIDVDVVDDRPRENF